MKTDQEIKARIRELESTDFFGFIRSDLIEYLPFDDAKEYFKEGVTSDQWTPRPRDHASVVAQILDYMPFAWDKANNCRGLSAGRSLNHMQAWLWAAGEDAAAEGIDDYSMYGKPQLRAICEHFGWDWRQWDNDEWTNNEGHRGSPADSILPVELKWAA